MHSPFVLVCLLGLITARPVAEENQVSTSSHTVVPWDGLYYGYLQGPIDSAVGLPSQCSRVFNSLKAKIKPVLHNKNMSWQPGVEEWWKLHQDELIKFIVIVHKVASDDFDDYVMWVHHHPKVPDGERHASYLAAQAILDYVAASGVNGPWGAFHLVTRVSKWLLLQPGLVNKWKRACFANEEMPIDTHL